MEYNINEIYQRVLNAQAEHVKFLSATEKNLGYFFFGKSVTLIKQEVFPQIDVLDALTSYTPEPYNPLGYLISSFIDEIANSEFKINVKPWPVTDQEPYEAYADHLEGYLGELHRRSKRRKYIRGLVFELLAHGYFGIYTNGFQYFFLTPYELIPGDPSITDIQKQPFIVRKTKVRRKVLSKIKSVDISKEMGSGSLFTALEDVGLYDVWIKDLDLNICITEGGQLVFAQPFPYPKKYPFFLALDTELLNSFYPIPLMQRLGSLLSKYQDSLESVEESSKSIAKPLLVYDEDAGIDIGLVQRALKEGYKHIIIGKNREGDIGFRSPGALPAYSVQMSDRIVDQMMKHLGLTSMFLGSPTAGVRERGAVARLIKASFRKLGTKASLIEDVFSELDEYLLEYLRFHKMKASDKFKFKNVEEIFSGPVNYIPEERFHGFSSEDTYESKMFSLSQWKSKLIPHEEALRELGHSAPRKLMEKIKNEAKDNQEFASGLKVSMETERPKGIVEEVSERLAGKLNYRFYLTPIVDGKVLISCNTSEMERVAFILADLSTQILIEGKKEAQPPTEEQKDIEVKEKAPVEEPTEEPTPETPEVKGQPVVPSERIVEETRGRPETKLKTPEEAIEKEGKKEEEAIKEPVESEGPGFSGDMLQKLIRRSKTIRISQIKKYLKLPGLYITEPHAGWISTGKKLLLVKARKFDILDKPFLLCGKQVYGVIICRTITDDFDFAATQKYHLVSDAQRKKWWKGNKLYVYMFEFHPFERALDYEKEDQPQTFIKNVKIKPESIGLPFTGDIKPISLTPWKIPTPHKPEKKAFQPHEVYSLERLKQIIPEASYDVSFKVDGLRAFLWVHDGKAKMFSDTGAEWHKSRVGPLLETAQKKFRNDILLDGELVMKGVERKDVAGFIHGKWKPTPEQLDSLRYICWDVLYIKDKSIASLPFSKRSAILDLYLPYKATQTGKLQRVSHGIAKTRKDVIPLAKKFMSAEGIVIRDINAAYWATHCTYKMKKMFDVDAKVIAVEKTKFGLPIFQCELKGGIYIGQTYAQSEVKAKPGEVIRVNIQHVTLKPDGSIGWYAPRPRSWKQGKVTPKKISTTQVGIGGPDSMDLIKEIYLMSGTEEKWRKWYPKFLQWKKEKMPAYVEGLKKKVAAGTEASKT